MPTKDGTSTRTLDASTETTLWDARDVARFLKVSRSWVYHRAESGELPCLRFGGLVRFDPAAIRAFARGELHLAARVIPLRKV
jgi:excisionase family DNA binding protein